VLYLELHENAFRALLVEPRNTVRAFGISGLSDSVAVCVLAEAERLAALRRFS
jgi:hypothetical protein